jgi:hypothetical protein
MYSHVFMSFCVYVSVSVYVRVAVTYPKARLCLVSQECNVMLSREA